jgi:hypothetical protein
MPKYKPLPPLERLNELLEVVEIPPDKYGQWSGLVWKVDRKGGAKAASVAGYKLFSHRTPDRGDWMVKVDGVKYAASRLIYYMTFGVDPSDGQIDHINRNWLDNNASNLRLDIDGSIQSVNRSVFRSSVSGVTGVIWNKKVEKWQAGVGHKGRLEYLGCYVCKIEAARTVRGKWIELGWDKLGRELPDLDKLDCDCFHCAPHRF